MGATLSWEQRARNLARAATRNGEHRSRLITVAKGIMRDLRQLLDDNQSWDSVSTADVRQILEKWEARLAPLVDATERRR